MMPYRQLLYCYLRWYIHYVLYRITEAMVLHTQLYCQGEIGVDTLEIEVSWTKHYI